MQVDVKTTLTWHGDDGSRFIRSFKAACNDGAKQAAQIFKEELRRKISLRVVKLRSGKVVYRSRPGEPPRREFGKLWRGIGIFQDRHRLHTIIYTNVEYARALELGDPSKNLAPRPSWIPTFLLMHRRMANLIIGWVKLHIDNWHP